MDGLGGYNCNHISETEMTILCPILNAVQIEINSHCNRKCLYCPNHDYEREEAYLPSELFYKIIQDLIDLDFAGRLNFNMFNEPLLDDRIIEFTKYASKHLPDVHIYLNTNGDFLTFEKYQELQQAGVREFHISQYDGKILPHIQTMKDKITDKLFYVKVFDPAKHACNRAGLVNLGNEQLPLQRMCPRPFYQLSINYKGEAVLCCNDYFGDVVLGDVYNESIQDIWESPKLVYYRIMLADGDRDLPLCRTCNQKEGTKHCKGTWKVRKEGDVFKIHMV